jgi:hypothetical protein
LVIGHIVVAYKLMFFDSYFPFVSCFVHRNKYKVYISIICLKFFFYFGIAFLYNLPPRAQISITKFSLHAFLNILKRKLTSISCQYCFW